MQSTRDFSTVRKSRFYVDRSLFIEKVVDGSNYEFRSFHYPPGTGKSVNLSMLRYFFAETVNGQESKELFNDLVIADHENIMLSQGKYAVIYLDFNDVTATNAEQLISIVRAKLSALYREHEYVLQSDYFRDNTYNQEEFKKTLDGKSNQAEMQRSIVHLAEYIYFYRNEMKIDNSKPIVLIDGYDSLVGYTDLKKYKLEDGVHFLSMLLSSLKDCSYIEFAIATQQVDTTTILPNNVVYFSPDSPRYSDYFGAIDHVQHTENTEEIVVYDHDGGPDDLIALSFLLSQPQVKIAAITIAGTGEVHPEIGANNTANVCELFGRGRIPIAYGSETACGNWQPFPGFLRALVDKMLEGKGVPKNPDPDIGHSAIELMKKVAENSDEKITLLATGPLTNVAQFIEAYPALKTNIKRIVIMGGAVKEPGNIPALDPQSTNKVAEWNIYADSVAADIVFRSAIPITLVSLDATNQVPMTRKFYDDLSKATQRGAQLVFKIIDNVRTLVKDEVFFNDFYLWDPLASMILVNPELGMTTTMALKVVIDTAQTKCVEENTEGAAKIDVVTTIVGADCVLDKLVEAIDAHLSTMQQNKQANETALPTTIPTNLFQRKVENDDRSPAPDVSHTFDRRAK